MGHVRKLCELAIAGGLGMGPQHDPGAQPAVMSTTKTLKC